MFKNTVTRFRRWKKAQQGIRELRSMTDKDLADIGISRYDIERIVREATLASDI